MVKKIFRIVGIVIAVLLALFAFNLIRNWETIQRTMLGGLKIYETTPPELPADIARPAILVFSKTNGFRHEEAIPAANKLFGKFAAENGWGYFQTENGATFSPDILSRFDAVIFNNTSGDVFTPDQRAAFKAFVEKGGGFVGIHAAGDDSHEAWSWYMEEIIGTTFIGHSLNPQFQKATVNVEDRSHVAARHLPEKWVRTEEWYSFDRSPRRPGVHIIATLDERTYDPGGFFGRNLAMGEDHPAIWWRCVGSGRMIYSIMGHRAEAFAEPEYAAFLLGATRWALRAEGQECNDSAISSSKAGQGE